MQPYPATKSDLLTEMPPLMTLSLKLASCCTRLQLVLVLLAVEGSLQGRPTFEMLSIWCQAAQIIGTCTTNVCGYPW